MDTKIIGIILLVCAGLVFQYGYEDFMGSFYSPEVKLKSIIEKDIHASLSQEVKEADSNIHHAKIVYRSNNALSYLSKNPPQFKTNEKGNVWLEVEVLDLEDNEAPGFITQISVFDLKTKNKISEFGQTYHYKDYDKNFKLIITEASQPAAINKALESNDSKENKELKKEKSNSTK